MCIIAALLWYTGHGEEFTGNWCFKDGFISFDDIFNIYQAHFRGRLLMIVTDCCYAGQWVLRFKEKRGREYLSRSEMLLKVYASCQPNEKAYDGVFTSRNVSINLQQKITLFDRSPIRVGHHSQTPCLEDGMDHIMKKKSHRHRNYTPYNIGSAPYITRGNRGLRLEHPFNKQ